MMKIFPVPALQDNYVWCLTADERHAVVVDPGEADAVREVLQRKQLLLSGILVTHHHADHQGGVDALRHDVLQSGRTCPVWAPANECITGRTEPLVGGEVIDIFTESAEVWAVPGHTEGHVAYWFERQRALFCGDTLFGAGCGRLFEGTADQLFAALSRMARLPLNTRIYCAHEYTLQNLAFARAVEPYNTDIDERVAAVRQLRADKQPSVPSFLAEELATNPFLRCHEPAVRLAAQKHDRSLSDNASAAEVFAVLRTWRNVFRA